MDAALKVWCRCSKNAAVDADERSGPGRKVRNTKRCWAWREEEVARELVVRLDEHELMMERQLGRKGEREIVPR